MARRRICKVCGQSYSYCPTCYGDRHKPTWYMMFCSDKCHDLWNIVCAYQTGQMTKDEAKETLEKLGAINMDTLDIKLREIVKEIINPARKAKKFEE